MKNSYSTKIKIVILLSVLGMFLAWYGVFKSEEYALANKYLINELTLDSKLGVNSKHFLLSCRVNGGARTTSRFTFLVIKGLDLKLVTLKLDKKVEPWKLEVE
jgi:hypothetical protein